ncbi:MAG: ROK family protein [Saccharofermentanales bacterium]
MKYSIGVDCGGTKVAYGLFNNQHELIDRREHKTKITGTPEEILQPIVDTIISLTNDHNLKTSDLHGVGIAFPSFIDFDKGYIHKTTNIVPLKNFYARDYFEKQLQTKVAIDNDSHVLALAEHRFGAGKEFRHMLYCCISTGISSGIIINNQLFRGSYGAAGESGHMLMKPDEGILCGCGNKGCFMSLTSGSMIVRHIQNWIAEGEPTIMLEMADNDPQKISAITIEKAVLQGDALAIRALEQMAYYLGVWAFNLYQTLNINCYVLGGGMTKFGEMLFEPMRNTFYSYLKDQGDNPVYFKIAALGDDFGIIGAEQLLFE